MKLRTNDSKWWDYQGWDLGYDAFNHVSGSSRIGIEASYEVLHNNPLGRFRIYITTWKIKDFAIYEDRLVELFPKSYLDKTNGDRVFLHVDVIEDNDIELIVEKLIYYYELMQTVVDEITSLA